MLHTEVIECLKELEDETLSKVMRMIFDWYDEKPVEPQTQIEKFAWKFILPKLEMNKETYLSIVERNKENGKKGGAPVGNKNASKNKTTEGLNETTQNNPKQHNYNYNSINSSKEELNNNKQPSSPDGDEVVSKGLESLEKLFPEGKNRIGIDEVNLWNSLTQEQKKIMIKWASVYIRNENKNNDGKFIKGIGKWMREQVEKGLEEKLPSVKNSTKSDEPRLLKMIDGTIYSILYEKTDSNIIAEKIYYRLNLKELFSTREKFLEYVKGLDQEEINELKEIIK